MTKLVIDSTCDIPKRFLEQYDIATLPLRVIVSGKEYLDRVTITTKEVYNKMRAGELPTTSQVPIPEAYAALEKIVKEGHDIICLTFAANLSGTHAAISTAAQELSEKYPERKIRILDSRGGSFATGLIVLDAARMCAKGAEFEKIVSRAEFFISHVEHVFVISDLTWAVRGGRVSRTLGYTANLFGIKPICDIQKGEMQVIHKVRGHKHALQRVADIVAERAKHFQSQLIGITHADDIESAEKMHGLLSKLLPKCEFMIEEIGAVLGTHLGIGGVGVFFLNRDAPPELA